MSAGRHQGRRKRLRSETYAPQGQAKQGRRREPARRRAGRSERRRSREAPAAGWAGSREVGRAARGQHERICLLRERKTVNVSWWGSPIGNQDNRGVGDVLTEEGRSGP